MHNPMVPIVFYTTQLNRRVINIAQVPNKAQHEKQQGSVLSICRIESKPQTQSHNSRPESFRQIESFQQIVSLRKHSHRCMRQSLSRNQHRSKASLPTGKETKNHPAAEPK